MLATSPKNNKSAHAQQQIEFCFPIVCIFNSKISIFSCVHIETTIDSYHHEHVTCRVYHPEIYINSQITCRSITFIIVCFRVLILYAIKVDDLMQ